MNHRTSRSPYSLLFCLILIAMLGNVQTAASPASKFTPPEGEYILKNVHFKSGETLPELHMHYMTLGKPAQDSSGRVTNGPSPSRHGRILPPISGSQFANELFGPGQLLDIDRYYIILPDNVGPGKSSKPSDGMHARFPQYDYDDMVRAQYDLLTLGLGDRRQRADSHAEESSDARAD